MAHVITINAKAVVPVAHSQTNGTGCGLIGTGESNDMKILGLRCVAGMPILDVLCSNHDNKIHENHIEIARRYWLVEPNKWAAIVLIFTDNDMSVYTATNFMR